MSAAPTPEQFTDASRRLQAARCVYRDFANSLTQVKYGLETKKAQRHAEGVEGKNQEQREAVLRKELEADFGRLLRAETALTDARAELDNALTVWDCLRYQLRLAEVETAELRRVA